MQIALGGAEHPPLLILIPKGAPLPEVRASFNSIGSELFSMLDPRRSFSSFFSDSFFLTAKVEYWAGPPLALQGMLTGSLTSFGFLFLCVHGRAREQS